MSITICSIAPEKFFLNRESYRFSVTLAEAPPDGYTSATITDQEDVKVIYQDLTHIDRVPVPISAEEIKNDFFNTENLHAKGCFVPKNAVPTESELDEARRRRNAYLLSLAEEGDRLYSQFGDRGIERIPDYAKRAIRELGEERKWALTPGKVKKTVQCEGCGTKIELLEDGTKPAICSHCKAPIDMDKAIKLGLWVPPHAPHFRKPYVPRKTRTPKSAPTEPETVNS